MKSIKKILCGIITVAMAFSFMSTVVLADETEAPDIATEDVTAETQDLSNVTFENAYGSQLYPYLNHKYTFQGKEIPVEVVNFYFINAFIDLCNYTYYGYPATAEGFIDLAAEMGENDQGYTTFADFFVEYAEQGLASTYVILDRAQKEGVKLSDETLAEIDSLIADLEANDAKSANMSVDDYIKLYYGPTCDKEAFKKLLADYYLTDLYASKYCESYEFTEEQKYVPNIRYALFFAPSGSDEATLKAAEQSAKDLLAKSTSLDALKTEAEALAVAGTVHETNDIACSKGQTVPAFDSWAWDSSRKEGDIDMILSEEYGYFVVGYVGKAPVAEDELNEIAAAALNEEISSSLKSGEYKLETKDTFAPPVVVPTLAADPNDPSSPAITMVPVDDNQEADDNGSKTDVLYVVTIVLATLGGVALVAVVVMLVMYFVKKNKNGSKAEDDEPEISDEE